MFHYIAPIIPIIVLGILLAAWAGSQSTCPFICF